MDNLPVSVSLVSFCILLGVAIKQHSRNQMWGGRPRPRRTPWSGSWCVRAGRPGGRPRARGPAPRNRRRLWGFESGVIQKRLWRLVTQQIRGAEEEAQFGLRGVRRVRAVYRVALDAGREPLADGALRGVGRVGGAHGLAPLADGVLALQRHHDEGPFGHELHQPGEEWFLAMHRVESLGLRFAEARHAQRENPETGLLDGGENLARVPRGHRVRFDDGERSFQTHKRLCTFSPISAGVEHTVIPASSMASILSDALPEPPAMIAPAWPMRRPGGAVWPATNPITGLRTLPFT